MRKTINARVLIAAASSLVAAFMIAFIAVACCVSPSYADDAATSNGSGRQYGTDYSSYPVYEGTTTDEYGFQILTEAACGCQLKHGVSYRVVSDVTLNPGSSEYISGLVADCNLIYINAGCTLTVYGSNGNGQNPGLPGIALTSGKNLFLTGEGTVNAYGGKAGDAQDGKVGNPARRTPRIDTSGSDGGGSDGDWVYSGNGGDGGNGGGGAGAGIGTAGGKGGTGGAGAREAMVWCSRDCKDDNGSNGVFTNSQNAGAIDDPGQLCIAGNVTVNAQGGDRSTYVPDSGNAAEWFYTTSSLFTKHLSGGSGGGGAGAGGSSANGYGKGGEGGGGGGGGGSAGAMWRVRGTSDTPPSASGGCPGKATNADGLTIKYCGGGSVRTIGNENCHGGTGAPGGDIPSGSQYSTNSAKFTVLALGNAARNASLPVANRLNLTCDIADISATNPSQSLERVIFPTKVSMDTLADYTGYSDVKGNGGWYVSNKLFNVDGTQKTSWEFATIASITTVKQVEEALASKVPTQQGATFKGWAFSDDLTTLVYDAQTKKLNTQLLVDKKKVIMSSSTEGVWWCATRTELTAVWEKTTTATFSIVYHTNGGTFVTTDGKAVEGSQYVDAGHPLKGSVTLWDNNTIGKYHLNPPASMASTTKLLGWTRKVEEDGSPDGTIYDPGASVSNLEPDKNSEVHLYAVWKRGDDNSATSSASPSASATPSPEPSASPSASPS